MEKKDKKKNHSTKKIIMCIISISLVFIILLALTLLWLNHKEKNIMKIAKDISEMLNIEFDENFDYYSRNSEHSYNEEILVYNNDIDNKLNDELKENVYNPIENNLAFRVLKFNSNYEAKEYYKNIKNFWDYLNNTYKDTAFTKSSNFKTSLIYENDICIIKGSYLVYLNDIYSNKKNIKNRINNILKKYNYKDRKNLNKKEIAKYWSNIRNSKKKTIKDEYEKYIKTIKQQLLEKLDNMDGCLGLNCNVFLQSIKKYEAYSEFNEEMEKIKNKSNEIMEQRKNTINEINNDLDNAEASLDSNLLETTKNKIEGLKDVSYDEEIENTKKEWENRLQNISDKIFKNSCVTYNYKDVLRTPDEYKNKPVYWWGKVLQKIGKTNYRVGVSCEPYTYIGGYHCDNTIYVIYNGNENFIEDDMVEIWGTKQGNYSYETVLHANTTVPLIEAKFMTIK